MITYVKADLVTDRNTDYIWSIFSELLLRCDFLCNRMEREIYSRNVFDMDDCRTNESSMKPDISNVLCFIVLYVLESSCTIV